MRDYRKLIDMNTTGNRYDVSPIFADHEAFSCLLDDLVEQIGATEFEYVAAIDALGFVLGTALALRMGKGLIVVRKGGKLPVQTETVAFRDYSGQEKSLELRPGILGRGMRVLVVDEWVETRARVLAAIALIEKQGAAVAGVASIQIDAVGGNELRRRGYACIAVGLK